MSGSDQLQASIANQNLASDKTDGWGAWLSNKVASAEAALATVLVTDTTAMDLNRIPRAGSSTNQINNQSTKKSESNISPPEERLMSQVQNKNIESHQKHIDPEDDDDDVLPPLPRRSSTIDIALADAWGAVRRVASAAMGFDNNKMTNEQMENTDPNHNQCKLQPSNKENNFNQSPREDSISSKDLSCKENHSKVVNYNSQISPSQKQCNSTVGKSLKECDVATLDDPFEGTNDIIFKVVEENRVIIDDLSIDDNKNHIHTDPLTDKSILATSVTSHAEEVFDSPKHGTHCIKPASVVCVDHHNSIEHFGLCTTPSKKEEEQSHSIDTEGGTFKTCDMSGQQKEVSEQSFEFDNSEIYVDDTNDSYLDNLREKFNRMFEQNGGAECVARVKEIGDEGLANMKDTAALDEKVLAELDDAKLILDHALQRLDAAVRSKVNDQHPEYEDTVAATDAVINETRENADCRRSTRQGHFADLVSDGSRLLAVFATKICDSVLSCLETDKKTATWSERVERMAEIATLGVSQLRTVSSKFAESITSNIIVPSFDGKNHHDKEMPWPIEITRLNELAIGHVLQCVALAIAALQVEAAERAYQCSI